MFNKHSPLWHPGDGSGRRGRHNMTNLGAGSEHWPVPEAVEEIQQPDAPCSEEEIALLSPCRAGKIRHVLLAGGDGRGY